MSVILFADTVRSPELRHEIPLGIGDAFLYLEHEGRRIVVVSVLESDRVAGVGDFELHAPEEFGNDDPEILAMPYAARSTEVAARACKALGVREGVVPPSFPLELADRLRQDGVTLRVDRELFAERRRQKTPAELEGIRRAQRATEAGMRAAADMLHRAEVADGAVVLDGEPLTSERLKQAIHAAFTAHGAAADDSIVAIGPQGASGHDAGSGPVRVGQPVVIDLFPRDTASACFADMTRTFVVGEVPAEVQAFHEATYDSLQRSLAQIRAGVEGRAVFEAACAAFEERGYPTQLTKQPGQVLRDGFFHGLGHGVGLEVHEAPSMGRAPGTLAAGDVVTVEPGCYRAGYGGVRLEDLVIVTEDGYENLTDFPYELQP
jgi:Xaa-Pro aminopeptidase